MTAGRIRARAAANPARVEHFMLGANGWVPNNEALPVVLYRNALGTGGADPAAAFEDLLQANGWPPQWRAGVYDFHHYHTMGHEVLGFAAGSARLMLGGPNAREVAVRAGDIALLPAGTGHMNLGSSDDFLVVGAYPPDQTFDIVREAPTPAQQTRLKTLPWPARDPVEGADGPVLSLWHRA